MAAGSQAQSPEGVWETSARGLGEPCQGLRGAEFWFRVRQLQV